MAPCVAHAELDITSASKVFASGQPLFVFGHADPGEDIIIRMTGPDGTITKFDQISASADGTFQHTLLVWPEATVSFPYGTYTVEILSAQQGLSRTVDVRFAEASELVETPVSRVINMLIFAPETSAVNNAMRVFVQTTSDGLLVGGDPRTAAGDHPRAPARRDRTRHKRLVPHAPPGTVLRGLHPRYGGRGTYVFHAVAFSQGTISHGSAATTILSQDIGGISEQIIRLNEALAATSAELDGLKGRSGRVQGHVAAGQRQHRRQRGAPYRRL